MTPMATPAHRLAEALLFAAREPLTAADLARRLPPGTDVAQILDDLTAAYANRGFGIAEHGGRWAFHTAPDLAPALVHERVDERPLGRAAMETLAIIAYHEPATRAEIEDIRGVAVSADTLGVLAGLGWVAPTGRRATPGRPLQYRTTAEFCRAFDLGTLADLPNLADLQASGLLGHCPPEAEADIADPELPGLGPI